MFMLLPVGSDKVVYGLPWFTILNIGLCVLV